IAFLEYKAKGKQYEGITQTWQTAVQIGDENLKQLLGYNQLIRIDQTLGILVYIEDTEQCVEYHNGG
ncbi:hypothetical protein LI169_21795, partial [Desulfovibrio desulfuricans]|nr:hypothetical protein [Desulfovibrio desulfuricans]